MPFDGTPGGGESYDAWCNACRQPIRQGELTVKIDFPNDPDGIRGLTGTYHRRCSMPFASLARAAKMIPPG